MMQHCPNCGYSREATNIFQYIGAICPNCFGMMGCYTVTGRRVGLIGFLYHQNKANKSKAENRKAIKNQASETPAESRNLEPYWYLGPEYDEEKPDDFPYEVDKPYFDIE